MQPVTGDYKSVPDFIYGITREIWEDRGVGGKLDRYYGANCLVRAATGLAADNKDVTAQNPRHPAPIPRPPTDRRGRDLDPATRTAPSSPRTA